MISSTKSPRVKNVTALLSRAKERKKQKLFIVEGPRMFEEIPAGLLRETYVAEGYLAQHGEEAERMLDGTSYEIVTDDVMRAMSDTIHPQGVLAVVSQKEWAPEDVLTARKDGHPALLMVLETLQDPGNLGTILRQISIIRRLYGPPWVPSTGCRCFGCRICRPQSGRQSRRESGCMPPIWEA